jgi:hypothetical protein
MQEGERVCASNEEIFGALLSFPAANQTVKEKRVLVLVKRNGKRNIDTYFLI